MLGLKKQDFWPRINNWFNILKGFFFKSWCVKKCRIRTFKVSYLCQKSTDFFQKNCILLPKLLWPTVRKNVLFSDQEKRLKFEAENFKNFEITRTIYSSISYKSKKYKIQLLELNVDRPLLCCVIFYSLGLFRICTVSYESKEYNVKSICSYTC